jgi:hypothetical protein
MEGQLDVQLVYNTLNSALSMDNASRSGAEATLKAWESDAAPGFISSLLKVAAETQAAVAEVRALMHPI